MKIKDSGERREFESGFVRDIQDDKPRFDLMWPEGVEYEDQPLYRVAMLYAKGLQKYGLRNWELTNTEEELESFYASLDRHLNASRCGRTDEDHMAAVIFNAIGIMTLQAKLRLLERDEEDELYGGSEIHGFYKESWKDRAKDLPSINGILNAFDNY